MNKELLAEKLAELPLYTYEFVDPAKLEFNERIRWICQHECPMYGKAGPARRQWAPLRNAKTNAAVLQAA